MDTSPMASDNIIVIVTNECEIYASKQALIENSDYFRAMFQLPMKESQQSHIDLRDCDGYLLTSVIHFPFEHLSLKYKDSLELIEILATADAFQFNDVVQYIKSDLNNLIKFNLNNAWRIYAMKNELESLGLELIVDEVTNFIDLNATNLLKHESINEVPVDILKIFLQRDTFAANEELILSRITQFMALSDEYDNLLEYVRYCNVTKEKMMLFCCQHHKIKHHYANSASNDVVRHFAVKDTNLADKTFGFTDGFMRIERCKQNKKKYVEYLLKFKLPVAINYIKFKLQPLSKNVNYLFVLETSLNADIWDGVYNSMKIRQQNSTEFGREFRFNKKVIQYLRLLINSVDFEIIYFNSMHCDLKYPIGYSKFRDRENNL